MNKRPRLINEQLRVRITRRQRNCAVREMDTVRAELPKVSTDKVVSWIREDRKQGH